MWSDRCMLSKEVFLFELGIAAEKTKMEAQILEVKDDRSLGVLPKSIPK